MKARKILSAILAAVMLLSVCVTGISAEEKLPFTDVPEGEWYYDAVAYTYGAGLMNGTGDGTKFSPMMNLTRGMVVTVLYRNDGGKGATAKNPFSDIKGDEYYAGASAWAHAAGVVTGTGEDEWGDPIFSPDRNITRQELATMFARYAAYRHVDTAKNTTSLESFPDSGKVASWAADCFKWSAGTGIITGKGGGGAATLSPEDLATRAEFAIMIERFNSKDDAREFTYKLAYTEPMPISSFTEPTYEYCDDADVFVSVDGDDKNPGTKEKPLATFEGAKAKVQELLKTAKDDIVVAFMAGNYGTLNNLTFRSEDSGTADVNVTYRTYGDGDVIFQNGVDVPATDFVKVDESDYYLLGDVDKSKVYKADLSDKIESLTSKSILFSETGICHEARVPNKGTGSHENAYWNVTTTYNERESILLQSYLPGKLEAFRSIEGMKVTGMLRTGWLVDTFPVKSYDPDTKVLSFDFDDPTAFGNGYTLDHFPLAFEGRMDDYLYFHNLSDQIDAEGEYWFDQATKTLYMYEPKGDYYISESGKFMSIYTGAEYLSFVGLDFIATTDSAIELDSSHITFDDCKIGNVAGHAAIYSVGTHPVCFVTIKNCEIYNFVDTGIEIYSNDNALESITPTGIVIENNYFHDFSMPQYWAHGIQLFDCVGARIAHNEFVNGAHAAIRYDSCIDTVIEYNIFDNMMMSTQDYGAVYSFRQLRWRSNVIRYNIFKNIRVCGGAYGVYIDGSYGQEFYGNIFYNAGDRNFVTNGGRDNIIKDNICIKGDGYKGTFLTYNSDVHYLVSGEIVEGDTEKGKWGPGQFLYDDFQKVVKESSPYYGKWVERWPILFNYTFDVNDAGKTYECFFTTVNHIKNNALIDFGIECEEGSMADLYGDFENNVEYDSTENPFFADPTHGDYSITDTTKFADNHFNKIGRY